MIFKAISKKFLFSFAVIVFGIVYACTEAETTPKSEKAGSEVNTTEDSLAIIRSDEYQRLVELLVWYKKGNGSFGISSVEKYDQSIPDSHFIYIDDKEVANYLKRSRNSGFFTKNYIHHDSLYIEEAKKAYADPEIEVNDYFDHDFILQTQETPETLKAIPNIRIVPEKCDLKKGKMVFSVASQELEYTFLKENGVFKLDKIK